MANFEGVLAGIPGYGGYLAKGQLDRKNTLSDIQQLGGVQGLMAQMQQQQMAQGIRGVLSDTTIPEDQKIQRLAQFGEPGIKVAQSLAAMQKEQVAAGRERDYRTALTQLGDAPTQEQLVGVASKFAAPDKLASLHQSSIDRAAQRDVLIANKQAELEARLEAARQRGADMKEVTQMRIDGEKANKEFALRLAASLRPERQEPAPAITQIVDPNDPTKMLSIDARQYRGGSIGSPGVIGASGKEPTAAKKEEQVGQGRDTVSSLISGLKGYYETLASGGGITNTEQSGLSNLGAGIASSGIGQTTGKLFGTKNQSARNEIAQQRPLLLNAIKQATGMSAKQMDSNAELKLYLSAATDPQLDLQANLSALRKLDELYGTGTIMPTAPNESRGTIRPAAPKAKSTTDIINQADAILKGR